MSIISLTDAHKNFEEIKLSPQKSFKIKSNYTSDPLNLFDEAITDANSIIIQNYPENGLTSYGLIPLFSYKTDRIKEIGSGGNTQVGVSSYQNNINSTATQQNVFNNITNALSKTRGRANTKLELDSNYFGVKRLQQELKSFSLVVNKKKIIENLYLNTKNIHDSKLNQNMNYGFYNYNCFNFFNILPGTKVRSQYKDNFLSNSHKNALIYTNSVVNNFSNNTQIKLGIDQDLTVNCWINPKRMASINKRYNPGCILHLPNILSLYLIPDNTHLNANGQAVEFKILCHLGQYANLLPENATNTNFDYKLTSTNNLKLNTWHNISVIINKFDVLLYVDNQITRWKNNDNNTDIADLNMQADIPSILTIGNRLANENTTWSTQNLQKLKNYFFNNASYVDQHLNDFEINTDNSQKLIDDLAVFNTNIFKKNEEDFNYALHSQALNAEFYGLMIFNREINFDALQKYAYGYEDIIDNIHLSFYLPCVYIADLIKRKGYITLGKKDDIAYRSVVNPYFAHKIYGHELSIESFILDVVNLRKPVVIGMSGQEYENAFSTNAGDFSVGDNIVLSDKIAIIQDYFKNHKNPNQLLNKVMTSNLALFDKNFSNKNFIFNNLIYRNNFILPCDNGLTKFNLTPIFNVTKIKNLIQDALSTFYHHSNPHYIKLDTLFLSNKEYSFDLPKNFFNNNIEIYNQLFNDPFVPVTTLPNKPNTQNFISVTLLDRTNSNYIQNTFYDKISNYDTKIRTQDFFANLKKLNTFNPKKHLLTNSIFKHIDGNYDASINIPENITWTSKTWEDNDISIAYSKYFNSHYSIEGELAETHSVIFDISNVIYSSKLRPKYLTIYDVDLAGSGGALNIKVKDNGHGIMYRADCNGKHATWSHLGHIFYNEGLVNILHPGLSNFGENNFTFDLKGEHSLYVMQIDIPIEQGELNISNNPTYIKGLKPSNNLSDLEETNFVYLTGVNIHDENLNIVAKAKFAQPIVKRLNDRYNIRLKMDF